MTGIIIIIIFFFTLQTLTVMVATFKCTEGPSVLLVITQQGINFSKRRTGNFANMGKSPTNAGMAEMAW